MKYTQVLCLRRPSSRSREGAWIEILFMSSLLNFQGVAPVRERGLKSAAVPVEKLSEYCRSREGAWIEIRYARRRSLSMMCRSREGAWIEIMSMIIAYTAILGRSREGAWIEIASALACAASALCRSREGAWIEILSLHHLPRPNDVAPVRERGLKLWLRLFKHRSKRVAPVRERGLKSDEYFDKARAAGRSREGAWIEII